MQHLTEEQLVAHYYHDGDTPDVATDHLRDCPDCRTQLDSINKVLSLVNAAPVPDRGEDYGERVWNRLRWKVGSERRAVRWPAFAAIAAALAIAFSAGLFWRSRPESHPVTATMASAPVPAVQPAAIPDEEAPKTDRMLLLVVSDHLDTSERVLLEIANANPDRRLDNKDQSKRAEELVSANRLYRQVALKQGDERIAELLSDIEPVLAELSHAGATIGKTELRNLQRRIESKGLLFKVRVISAQTGETREAAQPPSGTETL